MRQPRGVQLSFAESVNEYRNLNFLGVHPFSSSVTIDIQKGRVYSQRIIIAGYARGIKGDEYGRRATTSYTGLKAPFGKIEYRRAP